ncbi:hypothetical protein EDD63_11645 [Breznakia blatticola]|uniref:Uncharacterized protein n=1 Tax=Breznakia blatticola TaxID=1754012 RepID=A0A4R7ZPU2_9FIRM|nr:hypothetical protein [Breznakia blatticola]TDW19943.1 hypothetical protein EDD63_11645 [Breznakia blatticola]
MKIIETLSEILTEMKNTKTISIEEELETRSVNGILVELTSKETYEQALVIASMIAKNYSFFEWHLADVLLELDQCCITYPDRIEERILHGFIIKELTGEYPDGICAELKCLDEWMAYIRSLVILNMSHKKELYSLRREKLIEAETH